MPQQYTRTGVQERVNGAGRTWAEWFSMWSNRASLIPIPGVNGLIAFTFGAIGTGLESLSQLFKGNFGSAITAAATGSVATAVNTMATSGVVTWVINAGSALTTGSTLATHARKLTEVTIGGVTGIFGMKPEILSSHVAGIGSLDSAYAQNLRGPGAFASREAMNRGRDPREMYNSYRNGAGAEHVAALENARAGQQVAAGR